MLRHPILLKGMLKVADRTDMRSRSSKQKLPNDLFDQVAILATALDIDVVTRRDRRGKPTELSIPYGSPSESICGYRITRSKDVISAEAVGERGEQCRITPSQERRLRALCESLAARRRHRSTLRKASHRLEICT